MGFAGVFFALRYFINFLQDRVSSSSVEQGAIWHREAMVWMLAI